MELTSQEIRSISAFSKRELGAWGEEKAAAYLISLGVRILARNWRCRYGEIDIVAFQPDLGAILAVEVKTRRSVQAGIPEEAITSEKLQRMRMLIVAWLHLHGEICRDLHWRELRVQVIAIDLQGARAGEYELRYLREL